MSQENVEIVRAIWRDAQPRTTRPMEWTTLSTTRPTNRKARPTARNGPETICPISLKDVGVSPQQLYPVARRLREKGEIRKQGRGYAVKA